VDQIFLTLADELHFGRAAERLHVSTARVSQAMQTLPLRLVAAVCGLRSRYASDPQGHRA
jgi:hypothetical protein